MIVCFDLGGVLVRVRRTWGECAPPGAIDPSRAGVSVADDPILVEYQRGDLTDLEYLEELARVSQCSVEQAISMHENILDGCYQGVSELIAEIHGRGLRTGCLSNTNALHWATMMSDPRYVPLQTLEVKVASFQIKLNKPERAAYRAFETLAGVTSTEVLFFEDTAANAVGASEFGWKAFAVDPAQEAVPQILALLWGE